MRQENNVVDALQRRAECRGRVSRIPGYRYRTGTTGAAAPSPAPAAEDESSGRRRGESYRCGQGKVKRARARADYAWWGARHRAGSAASGRNRQLKVPFGNGRHAHTAAQNGDEHGCAT